LLLPPKAHCCTPKLVRPAKGLNELPKAARDYLAKVEELTGTPIDIVSTGPDREETNDGLTAREVVDGVEAAILLAEVDVDLIVADDEWAPCLSLQDAYRLDGILEAPRSSDLKTASRKAPVYCMQLTAI